jgi:hypothetical protein
MYTSSQLRTFTTTHLTGGGWYLDCLQTFTHPSEAKFRKSFDGLGVIDLDVPEFADLRDTQKKRAIVRSIVADKKKEDKEQEVRANKKKKEVERLAKLAEKEKEAEKEGKGKKKVEGVDQVPATSTVDQSSQMQVGSQSGLKRKAILAKFTENIITQGTQVIVLNDDEEVNSEELVLNISIVDVMDNEKIDGPNCYMKVVDFLKKVT